MIMKHSPFVLQNGPFKDLIHERENRVRQDFIIVYPQNGVSFIFESLSNCPPVDLRKARYAAFCNKIANKEFFVSTISGGLFSGARLSLRISAAIEDRQIFIGIQGKIVDALNRAAANIINDFTLINTIVHLNSINAFFQVKLPDELTKLDGISIKSIVAIVERDRSTILRRWMGRSESQITVDVFAPACTWAHSRFRRSGGREVRPSPSFGSK